MNALDYDKDMVSFDSTSSRSNADVSDYVENTLKKLDFITERIEYEHPPGVRKVNVVGKKGVGSGGLAYFAHTDVVPATTWFSEEHGPFTPTVVGDKLYGRGSCDMKGSIACMMAAAERFSAAELNQPIYITCTADEETGYGGAKEVVKHSRLYREMVDGNSRGIIGEPTRLDVVYAHKGCIGLVATSKGRAAHSSTREGLNANLAMIPYLAEMKAIHDETEADPAWRNDEFDPPTMSWNIGINDHTAAINITAPQSVCTVYFRPMPGHDPERLIERARRAAEANGLDFTVSVRSAPVYTTPESPFIRELLEISGKDAAHTVSYGTDGSCFGEIRNMAVIGPGNIAQAHTFDEWITLEQLEKGTELYTEMVRQWCV